MKYNDIKKDVDKSTEHRAKPSWKKASDTDRERYALDLETRLMKIDTPISLSCADVPAPKVRMWMWWMTICVRYYNW